jgi:hypothetical protein
VPGEADSRILGRLQVNEVPSPAYFDVAKRWLAQCEESHSECGDDVPELPSRVICVAEEGQDPYLTSGEGKYARYATLSHCWGSSTAAMTTLENLREHQRAIPLGILPKTFRDAIVVCRKLEIQYLWIDRLCIMQNSISDWEKQSSAMGSIYYNSTLTLAATVSSDSSMGLFVPKHNSWYDHLDFVTLPSSFGHEKGQVYLSSSAWGTWGPPFTTVGTGILQTRGWVMQENYLARRTVHFMEGEMVWWCCEKNLGQSGHSRDLENVWERSARAQLKLLARAFEHPWDLTESDDEEDESDSEDIVSNEKHTHNAADIQQASSVDAVAVEDIANHGLPNHATTLPVKDGTRALDILDLRDARHRSQRPPIVMNRQIDSELYDFLDDARRQTIYRIWYSAVATYSERRLTFASDKLPAMAGIASSIQAITHDIYLAGHWRRELERSLFWQTRTESTSCTPSRVKTYRAPSWSWASVDGSVSWDFANLGPGEDEPAPIKVLEASAEVEGDNPLGAVYNARLVLRAATTKARWSADHWAWMLTGTSAEYTETQNGDLCASSYSAIMISMRGSDAHIAGDWFYDDEVNGIFPGCPLSCSDPEEYVTKRRVPSGYYYKTTERNNRDHGKEFMDTPLWERGTYIPEEFVIVKGPTRKLGAFERQSSGERDTCVDILVLAETGAEVGQYRRVGVGRLASWDRKAESVQVLTIV